MVITKVSFHGRQISSFLNTVARVPETSEGEEGSCRLPVSDDSFVLEGRACWAEHPYIQQGAEERHGSEDMLSDLLPPPRPYLPPSPFPNNSTMLFVYKSEPCGLNNPGNPSKT